jgi:hypothetical protein
MRPIDLKRPGLRRYRHPFDRGGKAALSREILMQLLDGRTWRRHPKPFAKTEHGRKRRTERHFVIQSTCGFGCD